ncbi:MAG: asparagine synthetase B [Candidatus Bathyarchaeota archaeon]|nr:MAG: asparagine synthetase B [Candidatus Bathyarchaeota archaeon]
MGAIAAIFHRNGGNSVPSIMAMLKTLKHRGLDAQGIATPNQATIIKSWNEALGLNSPIALGHNLSRILPNDIPQPVLGNNFAMAFEGCLFPPSGRPEVEQAIRILDDRPRENAGLIIRKFEGSYVFAIAFPEKIVAGRDMFGVNPLYYGENESLCAIASERKALWAIKVEMVQPFPPGTIAIINAQGFSFKTIETIARPPLVRLNADDATKRLEELLLESTRRRTNLLQKVAVAFSGGLDSSVIAALAKKCGKEVHLVSVGLEDTPEEKQVKGAARALDLPLHYQTYRENDIQPDLSETLWLIEEPDVVKTSIALPFYWIAEATSQLGYPVLFAGQGGDELFGGYYRYLEDYTNYRVIAMHNVVYQDITACHERNFQRDNKVCAFHKVELRLPFVDREVIRFGLSLPVDLNIESRNDRLRKHMLRRVARNLGLPQFIYKKPKRAIQYSTGVSKALQRLARSEDLTLRKYISQVYQKIYPLSA